MNEITATLKRARRCGAAEDGTHLHGAVYGDTRGRGFADGDFIFTSTIIEELPESIFRTRHSTYKVEFAEGESNAVER